MASITIGSTVQYKTSSGKTITATVVAQDPKTLSVRTPSGKVFPLARSAVLPSAPAQTPPPAAAKKPAESAPRASAPTVNPPAAEPTKAAPAPTPQAQGAIALLTAAFAAVASEAELRELANAVPGLARLTADRLAAKTAAEKAAREKAAAEKAAAGRAELAAAAQREAAEKAARAEAARQTTVSSAPAPVNPPAPQTESKPAAPAAPVQCKGTKKDGEPCGCKGKLVRDNGFCAKHQDQAGKPAAAESKPAAAPKAADGTLYTGAGTPADLTATLAYLAKLSGVSVNDLNAAVALVKGQ
jgi:colicin import membrane protein